jgi:hypothetical protein
MTVDQFNAKYVEYLEEGHYGLAFGNEEFVNQLDTMFQKFIQVPGFKFSQIKAKFGRGRFYCEGLTDEQIYSVEDLITKYCEK